jgi:hypothetical protein
MDSWKAERRDADHRHDAAWRYLADQIAPDVALVQECVPPTGARGVWRASGISETRPWGSAVIVQHAPFEELVEAEGVWRGRGLGPTNLLKTLPGSVAIARVHLSPETELTVVSVYGIIEHGYASVLRILADLQPLFDDPRYNDNIVVAGDLNIGTQWHGDDIKYLDRDANTLGYFRALGLVDVVDRALPSDRGRLSGCRCTYEAACRHVRTQRHDRYPDIPYQTDYFFATEQLAERVLTATVWDREDAWAFSDHCPIVVDLEA